MSSLTKVLTNEICNYITDFRNVTGENPNMIHVLANQLTKEGEFTICYDKVSPYVYSDPVWDARQLLPNFLELILKNNKTIIIYNIQDLPEWASERLQIFLTAESDEKTHVIGLAPGNNKHVDTKLASYCDSFSKIETPIYDPNYGKQILKIIKDILAEGGEDA